MNLNDQLLVAAFGILCALGIVHCIEEIYMTYKRHKEEFELKKKSKSS